MAAGQIGAQDQIGDGDGKYDVDEARKCGIQERVLDVDACLGKHPAVVCQRIAVRKRAERPDR